MTKPKLATLWLDGCSGCHMSLLDVDEALLTIAGKADLVYGPLVDAHEFPPDVDVTIVEGGVSTDEDLEKLRRVRECSKFLVALGDCATTSNISAMRNMFSVRSILNRIYIDGADEHAAIPAQGLPSLLKHVVPLHDVVHIDLHVPGCPPSAATILFVVTELLDGRVPDLRTKLRFG